MARDDEDFKERRRRREKEEEEEQKDKLVSSGNFLGTDHKILQDKIEDLLQRAEVMVDQVNSLYQMFVSGVDLRPPTERRKQLDQLIQTLTQMSKPLQIHKFRFGTLQSRYVSHRDRWDKLEKDVESGKIKRAAGPKKTAY